MMHPTFESSDYLTIARTTFRVFGIDIEASTTGKKIPFMRIFIFCAFSVGSLYASQLVVFGVQHRNDMNDVVEGFCLFTPWLLGIFKCSAFLWKTQEHIHLIKHLESLTHEANFLDQQIYRRENGKVIVVTKLYYYLAYTGMAFLSGEPFILMFINFCLGREFVLEPPYKNTYFFFDFHQWHYYILYVLGFFLFTSSLTLGSIPVDTLVLWYIQMLCSMYHVLCGKLKAVADTCGLEQCEDNFSFAFKNAVDYHKHLINLINEINELLSYIMFDEMLGSCCQLCMFAYQWKSGPSLFQIPLIILALTGMMLQLSIYCIGGQKLQNLSEMIPDVIYLLFPWDQMTTKQKRWMFLPLLRSQRSSYLETHFFKVNARLMLAVLKTTYSITALLSVVNEK